MVLYRTEQIQNFRSHVSETISVNKEIIMGQGTQIDKQQGNSPEDGNDQKRNKINDHSDALGTGPNNQEKGSDQNRPNENWRPADGEGTTQQQEPGNTGTAGTTRT